MKVEDLIQELEKLNKEANISFMTIAGFDEIVWTDNVAINEYQDGSYSLCGSLD